MATNLNTMVIYHRILTLENVGTVENCLSIFLTFSPGDNVIKPCTTVFCSPSMVILSFCVIKLYYHGMIINIQGFIL